MGTEFLAADQNMSEPRDTLLTIRTTAKVKRELVKLDEEGRRKLSDCVSLVLGRFVDEQKEKPKG